MRTAYWTITTPSSEAVGALRTQTSPATITTIHFLLEGLLVTSVSNASLSFGARDGATTVAVKYDLWFSFDDRYLNPFFAEQVALYRVVGRQDPPLLGGPDTGDTRDIRIAYLANQQYRPSDAGMPETAETFVMSRSINATLTAEEATRLREAGAGTAYALVSVWPRLPGRYAINVTAPIPAADGKPEVQTINRLPADFASFVRFDSRVVSSIVNQETEVRK